MIDYISRQDAIDAIMDRFAKCQAREQAILAINTVPSAQPKTGEWRNIFSGFGTCSACDHRNVIDNYCPHCGARMNDNDDR